MTYEQKMVSNSTSIHTTAITIHGYWSWDFWLVSSPLFVCFQWLKRHQPWVCLLFSYLWNAVIHCRLSLASASPLNYYTIPYFTILHRTKWSPCYHTGTIGTYIMTTTLNELSCVLCSVANCMLVCTCRREACMLTALKFQWLTARASAHCNMWI